MSEPATEAGREMVANWSADFLNGWDLHTLTDAIVEIESEAGRSTVVGPECYPQAHRYKAVPGSRDLVRCYRCGKERYA